MTFLSALPVRIAAFVLGAACIWAGYFWWRAPGPMLFLKHVEHLPRGSNEIAMTFDDAPHPLTTPLLLASLKRADIKATWFVVGDGLRLYPELAHRIVTEGHKLANHSQPHHNLTTVPVADYPHHVDACFQAIEKVGQDSGVPQQTRLFRPPGGGVNREVMQYLYAHNYTLAWWSNNPGDWTCPPPWKIARSVEGNMRPNDILLMHDGGTGTPQAIPAIVKEARSRGLNFVLMPEK
jgi:peptidoglycan/xylan/chitin deacetylase (PgdA/CDA1 family)